MTTAALFNLERLTSVNFSWRASNLTFWVKLIIRRNLEFQGKEIFLKFFFKINLLSLKRFDLT
jgi:hypothetical protein